MKFGSWTYTGFKVHILFKFTENFFGVGSCVDFALSIPPQLNLMLNSEDGGDISGFMPNGKTRSIERQNGKNGKSQKWQNVKMAK